ncbi:ghrelin O-acyltransferase [Trichomycterus rosablanca]|uniref:ghrelin O-acyltransferase n=1 Tax=Trichomycterus rosablanca TaxID=2290929 RepID=UPI002F35F245
MGLLSIFFHQNPQLVYQLFTIPMALIFYSMAAHGYLSVFQRYICLMAGGLFLAILTMGPYSMLLFIAAAIFLLLVNFVEPVHIHYWVFGLQMGWQSFWHFYMQYKQYWLYESIDCRLVLAMSALMLLSQRVTSVSMDLQDGKVIKNDQRRYQTQLYFFIPLISYILNFPALLGGPLCSFNTYVTFVEQMSISPPPSPFAILPWKLSQVLILLALKNLLASSLQSDIFILSSHLDILWIWVFSLVLRLNYYTHWKISECLNNAAGLGFNGRGPNGRALWNGLSDGNAWTIESSKSISEFARHWNGTTATWLRRLVFQRCSRVPLLMTFSFSALWHGLYPGQVIGFLGWAIAVLGDYKLHKLLRSRVKTGWRKGLYPCLSWAYTQIIISYVVLTIELQTFEAVMLFSTTLLLFPLAIVILLLIL